MKEEKIRKELWSKASLEFEKFKKDELSKTKEEIFEDALKISMINDFTDMCDPYCGCLSNEEVKGLLKEKYPVHTLYNYYMKTDAGGINDLYESIVYKLNELAENNKLGEKQVERY